MMKFSVPTWAAAISGGGVVGVAVSSVVESQSSFFETMFGRLRLTCEAVLERTQGWADLLPLSEALIAVAIWGSVFIAVAVIRMLKASIRAASVTLVDF